MSFLQLRNIMNITVAAACAFSSQCSAVDLTLEEKVGQLLMVHFQGEDVNEDAKTLIQEVHVGGFIYYNWSNGLSSPRQVHQLSLHLQELALKTNSKIPLIIATDQEGGLVARLTKGFTVFPGNKALGMAKNPSLAKEQALIMGKELRAVGITMNLAPDVDVNSDPENPVIGIRSFSDSAEEVALFAQHTIQGYKEAKILTTAKHFPGHGDVKIDSHGDLPIIKKVRAQLDQEELLPFFAISNQVDAIMTAHLLVPALDPDTCSSLSKKTIDILRNEAHFDGVIITDSLVMEGLLKTCSSIDEAAIRSLEAGTDILLLGGRHLLGKEKDPVELKVTDIKRIHGAIVQAVKSGRLPLKRIDQAVRRVLALKNRYPLSITQEAPPESLSTSESESLSRTIAELALKASVRKPFHSPSYSYGLIAPEALKGPLSKISLCTSSSFYFPGLNPGEETKKEILTITKKTDAIFFFTYNAWKNQAQQDLVNAIIALGKHVVVIATRDPLDETLFPQADCVITTYSPTAPSLDAAENYLAKCFPAEKFCCLQ